MELLDRTDLTSLVYKHSDRILTALVNRTGHETVGIAIQGLKATINYRIKRNVKGFDAKWQKTVQDMANGPPDDVDDPDAWTMTKRLEQYEILMDAACEAGILDAKPIPRATSSLYGGDD